MGEAETLPPLPAGSDRIQRWAGRRGIPYEGRPDEAWFRKWEPHDTMISPQHFYNGVTWTSPPSPRSGRRILVVLVEPWTAPPDAEPIDRTVLAFATHHGLERRAAVRVGEHFLTRVSFLESPPPPNVKIGDKTWDAHVETYAASPSEAATAFHPALRKTLADWSFRGHLELRPGGLVMHWAGVGPTPEGYDRVLRAASELVGIARTKAR